MEVKFKGEGVKLAGATIKLGDSAPKVKLVANDLSSVEVGGASGKFQVINVLPSVDTGVCALQTKRFNAEAASLKNAEVFVISLDLPFAQKRFCGAEGIADLKTLSDFRGGEFGKAYGLVLDGSPLKGLLARAVIVVDPNGKVSYLEICQELTNEPNYEAALAALK